MRASSAGLCALALSAAPAAATDGSGAASALIACIDGEIAAAACMPEAVCNPGWAFYHRQVCARDARAEIDAAMAHYRADLLALLATFADGAALVAAEEAAQAAWLAYRDANCSIDRSSEFDVTGREEAEDHCRIGHAVTRIDVIRGDIDRFRFRLAAAR